MEQILGRALELEAPPAQTALSGEELAHLRESAEELYWNELEWEKLTGEERLDEAFLTELAFPGLLAFVRGLLLAETMPDSLAPPRPSPEVVREILDFLAIRVVELEEGKELLEGEEREQREVELEMTSRLIDFVLYDLYGLMPEEVETVETALLSA